MAYNYFVFKTGYTGALVTANEQKLLDAYRSVGLPLVKFPLPTDTEIEGLDIDPEYWGSPDIDIKRFTDPGDQICKFLIKNHKESAYEVVFITDIAAMKIYTITDTSKSDKLTTTPDLLDFFTQTMSIMGSVIFRRKDEKAMSIDELFPLFGSMNIGYCTTYGIQEMKTHQVEGQTILVAKWDAENC